MSLISPAPPNGLPNASCDGCEDRPPTVFCGACQNSKYCASCDTQIHKLKNKCDHQRAPLSGETGGNAPAKVYFCATHAGKRSELFCEDCRALVCILCRDFGDHTGHSVRAADAASTGLREALRRETEGAGDALENLGLLVQQMEGMAQRLGVDGRDAGRQAVQNAFAALESAARDRQAQLREGAAAAAGQRRLALREQQDRLRALIEYGAESAERGRGLADAPASELAHGFKGCSAALASLLGGLGPGPAQEPACDAAVPFSADLAEIRAGAAPHGVIGGAQAIRLELHEDGRAVLHWRAPSEGWLPGLYRARLEVLDAPQGSRARRRYRGYERSLGDRCRAQSSAPAADCSVEFSARDLGGCSVLFSVQGYEGALSSAWVSAGGAVSMPRAFVRHRLPPGAAPFEGDGLFRWIGTQEGTAEFQNPAESGAISIQLSSLGAGSSPAAVLAAGAPPLGESVFTANEQNACVLVDIGADRLLRPTAYCLRHDMQGPRGALRNWVLQGSVEDTDEDEWVTLSAHEDDASLAAEPGATALFKIRPDSFDEEAYRYFRIVQTGPNSSGKGRLMCCGLELYGDVY